MIEKLRPAPLAFGLAFIAIGIVGFLVDSDVLEADWIWAIALIAMGVAGFITIATRLLMRDS